MCSTFIKWFGCLLYYNRKHNLLSSKIIKIKSEWKGLKSNITSFVLPNYKDYKKNVNECQNSSNCFPDDLITLAAFSICEENEEWKVKPKTTCIYQRGRSLLVLLNLWRISNYKLYIFWKKLVITLNIILCSSQGADVSGPISENTSS